MNSESEKPASWNWLFLCLLLTCVATLSSLFLSEVMERTPCALCWYQRIFMFPLPFILSAGLFPFDPRCTRYALPIAIAGWVIALYHFLLYQGVIPQRLQPCTQGVSCTDSRLDLFGFVTIPLLSLLAFTLIVALLLVTRKGIKS